MASGGVEAGASQYVKLRPGSVTAQEEQAPGELNQPIEVPQLNERRCLECGQTLPPQYEAPTNEPWTTGIFGCAEDPESCRTGLFCPCILFGKNLEEQKDIPWTTPCIVHGVFVEGGLALAALTAAFSGSMDPSTAFLIGEGLLFAWWMCGVYTGLFRQELQRKYHLSLLLSAVRYAAAEMTVACCFCMASLFMGQLEQNTPCDPCMVHCVLHPCAVCQEHREMKSRLSDMEPAVPMTVVNPPAVQEMRMEAVPRSDQNGATG
eukprot:SM000032S12154  [mRNA]  locus=s32:902526:904009:+ [translate_table: standard]